MNRNYIEKQLKAAGITFKRVYPTGVVRLLDGTKAFWKKLLKKQVPEEKPKETKKKTKKKTEIEPTVVPIEEIRIEEE